MSTSMAKKKTVNPGDCFAKVEAPATVWVVARLMDIPEAGEHVQMYQQDHPRRTLTVSKSALLDRSIFHLVEETAA